MDWGRSFYRASYVIEDMKQAGVRSAQPGPVGSQGLRHCKGTRPQSDAAPRAFLAELSPIFIRGGGQSLIDHDRWNRPIDPQADYGVFNPIAKHSVNTARILRHWEDLLRVAGSLKMGTVSASELMRSLLNSKRPSALAKAIGDLGRIPKTIYLLNYIHDETYRRRILTQINRSEGRHSLAREVFHGKKGELRQRYREGQEDQLGALGLVVNALVLWNTLYMEAALNQMERKGLRIRPEEISRLSPLGYQHFNFLGRYSFRLDEPVAKGQLRPLRNPNDFELIVA